MSLQSHFYVNDDEKRMQIRLSQIEKGDIKLASYNAARQASFKEEGEPATFMNTCMCLDERVLVLL